MREAVAEPADASLRRYLTFEYVALFFALPGILAIADGARALFYALFSATAISLWLLLRDRAFDRAQFVNMPGVTRGWKGVVALWGLAAGAMTALVWWGRPEIFLSLVRERPGLWALIMVGYPIISVYPQNIIYRGLIFQRYKPVFGDGGWGMVCASASAFCFAHVVFQNWIALGLTAVGGIIFAATYDKHRSILLSSIEHALYGLTVFTVGLGSFLYHGNT